MYGIRDVILCGNMLEMPLAPLDNETKNPDGVELKMEMDVVISV